MTSREPTQLSLNFTNNISNAHEPPLLRKEMIVQNDHTAAGAATSIGTMILSFLTAAVPVLQVIALVVSITVGVLTITTWVKKHRKSK